MNTDRNLSIRFDADQDSDLIEYLDSLGKGNVAKAIKAALRAYRTCNADAMQPAMQVAMQADADLIVKSFEWKDQQDQARHDTLLAALDTLTATIGKLPLQAVTVAAVGADADATLGAASTAPAPVAVAVERARITSGAFEAAQQALVNEPAPDRVSDEVLSLRAEGMKRAAWAT